jgi:hypothetical protein
MLTSRSVPPHPPQQTTTSRHQPQTVIVSSARSALVVTSTVLGVWSEDMLVDASGHGVWAQQYEANIPGDH